ncbi:MULTISPECIES: hypothetical protein [unclassified Nocardia]|uniref:hypothetical protein n=1 Tax=unclassified Nocardia TaxID=2637762 RepID=UPI003433104E
MSTTPAVFQLPMALAARRHIAMRLGLPAHILGVTGLDDAEYRAMLQFGDSTVRLAEIARKSGHAVEAVDELWRILRRVAGTERPVHVGSSTMTETKSTKAPWH